MNKEEQKQNMEEAFDLYLKKCCGIQEGTEHYGDISLVNKYLEMSECEESFYNITTIDDFKDAIQKLKESGLYGNLKRVVKKDSSEDSMEETEIAIDYTEVLDHYHNFLIAYKFAQAWIQPAKLFEEDDDSLAKNTIVFGAPGTGKSYTIKQFRMKMGAKYTSITFHPDTDYASFVGCYKPTKDEERNEITYKFVPQAFTKAYVNAWMEDKPYCLIIEEINRGNCAQIFGDIFQLLDRENDTSEYDNDTDTDLAKYLQEALANSIHPDITEEIRNGRKMMLPRNLWILATMNTSDQSLYPMDSAFKRRWEWKYIPFEKDKQDFYIIVDDVAYSWSAFLDAINYNIYEVTQSEDKQLGFRFVNPSSRKISASTFVNKVLFYLWNDIFKDRSENTPFTKCGLKFQSFFKSSIRLDYLNIKSFLEHGLGLQKVTIPVFKSKENSSVTRARKSKFIVTYNNHVFDDPTASVVFKDVICSIIEDKGIDCLLELFKGRTLFAKSAEEFGSLSNVQIDEDLYLLTNLGNKDKERILNKIAKDLNLDLLVNPQDENID